MRKPIRMALTTTQLLAAVEELEGVPLGRRALDYCVESGIVPPSIDPGRRAPKHQRLFNLLDLARLRLVLRLRREGMSMQRVRVVIAQIADQLPDVLTPNTKAVLEVDGPARGPRARVIVRRPGAPAMTIPGGQLLLPLAGVVKGNIEAARDARRVA